MIYHKNPVEESFIVWITLNPDSFHHLDMCRFYVFVRSVIRYNAKSWQKFEKFKKEIDAFLTERLAKDYIFESEHGTIFLNQLLLDFPKMFCIKFITQFQQ